VRVTDALADGPRSFDLEMGAIYNLRKVTAATEDPESFLGLDLSGGTSTLRPVNDADELVSGHSPLFGSLALRLESAYSSWGKGKTVRGFTEVGLRWFGPFGSSDAWRYNLKAGLAIPGISIGEKLDLFLYLDLDYPIDGDFENHSIGVFSNLNLKDLFG
jgi:hypothetical protein